MEALASLTDSSVLTLESTRKVVFKIQTASPWAGIVILLLELSPLQDPWGQLGPQHSASRAAHDTTLYSAAPCHDNTEPQLSS